MQKIQFYPQDYLLKYTIIPLLPKFVTPNRLTILRFILTPFVLLFLFFENYSIGTPLFIFTAFTDVLDGSLARIKEQITDWGIKYDPIADKILIGTVAIIFLSKIVSIYLALGIIFVEIITLASRYFIKQGKIVPANVFGKMKMLLQVIGIFILLIGVWQNISTLENITVILVLISFVFAFLSLVYDSIKTKAH